LKIKSIDEALRGASFYLENAGIENPRVEAEVLLSNLLDTDRLQLFLKRSQNLSSRHESLFEELIRRKAAGEPTAYITGTKEFYGIRFNVNKNVLIPRPETELLVDRALFWLSKLKSEGYDNIRVLDLGTGSGIIAITIALKQAGIFIDAVDISAAALKTARHNAMQNHVEDRISWHCGCYFEAFSECTSPPLFNMVISNPPYLTKHEMKDLPAHVINYEPFEALYGGEEGLDGYRKILNSIELYMGKPFLLLLEAGAGQQEKLKKLCRDSGLFKSITWHYDLAGHARVIEAKSNMYGF